MKRFLLLMFTIVFALATVNLQSAENESASLGSTAGGTFTKVGAAGSQFLKLGVGARGTGMGGAYVAVVDDLTALHWNPAGIADLKGYEAAFHHTEYFAGMSHDFAAVAIPISEKFLLAADLVSFGSGDIEITTNDAPEGTGVFYSVNDLAFGLAFSGYLTEQFSFGIKAKYIQNTFHTVESNGFAFDIGTKYKTGIQGIVLGFSIHNLGTQMAYEGQELRTTQKLYESLYMAPLDASYLAYPYTLPLIFRAGLSSAIIDEEDSQLIAAFDFATLSDSPEQYAFGLEYTWGNLVAVRAGYMLNHDQYFATGGAGLKYELSNTISGQVDYSIAPTFDLGLIHRFGINLSFK